MIKFTTQTEVVSQEKDGHKRFLLIRDLEAYKRKHRALRKKAEGASTGQVAEAFDELEALTFLIENGPRIEDWQQIVDRAMKVAAEAGKMAASAELARFEARMINEGFARWAP